MVLMVLPQNILFMLTLLLVYFYLCYSMLLFGLDIYQLILLKLPLFISLKSKQEIPVIKTTTERSPWSLSTSKLFEMCLLKILQMYRITHDHQFGFKTKHSAGMCIFTVKSIIKYYTGHNTPVYTCFHDASKTLDRVNHWTSFTKLIYSGISLLIVHILVFWYQTQQLCIKWGGSTSRGTTRRHLFLKIFAMYMNGLTDDYLIGMLVVLLMINVSIILCMQMIFAS